MISTRHDLRHRESGPGSIRVDDLDLSGRVRSALAQMGIRDLRALAGLTETQLLRSPNLGRKSLLEVKAMLAEFGLCLGMAFDEEGEAPAAVAIGRGRHELSDFLEDCRRRACGWYREVAARGCPSAHNLLGYMHQLGIGTQRDLAQARHHYLAAARMGYSLAIYNLGLLAMEEVGATAQA